MKTKLLFISTILSVGFQAQANEPNKWFVGAQYSQQEISLLLDREPETFGVIGGYRINEYFSVEARFNVGTSGFSRPILVEGRTEEYKEDIETQSFLLVRASYPIFDSVNVYALAGASKSKYEITSRLFFTDLEGVTTVTYPHEVNVTENGFTYGIGIDYQFAENFSVFLDHQVLPHLRISPESSENWTSTNIGLTYSF